MGRALIARYALMSLLCLLVLGSSLPMLMAAPVPTLAQPLPQWTSEPVTHVELRAIEQRLDKIEATHPEALVEVTRAQGEAIKSQQLLLWGVLIAVIASIIQNGMRGGSRRPRGE